MEVEAVDSPGGVGGNVEAVDMVVVGVGTAEVATLPNRDVLVVKTSREVLSVSNSRQLHPARVFIYLYTVDGVGAMVRSSVRGRFVRRSDNLPPPDVPAEKLPSRRSILPITCGSIDHVS